MRRTHCIRGHELNDSSVYTYVSKQGHNIRECKLCAKDKYTRKAVQSRENHLIRNYGITQATYDSMLAEQDGRCGVCRTLFPGGMGSFCVDHCHETGQIRKLLCVNCNTALGRVNDDPNLLEALAVYVRSFQLQEA